MRRLLACLTTVVACALFAAGCNTTDCPDCGGCGIAGPVDPGFITYGSVGVDAKGVAAADFNVENGPCPGDDVSRYRVTYVDGNVSVASADGLAALDETKVTANASAYSWTDRDLKLDIDRDGDNLVLSFTDIDVLVRFDCQSGDSGLTCAPQAQ